MIRRIALVGMLAGLCGGCLRGARPEPPEPQVKPYLGGDLQIGRWGVGPIRKLTYFESPRIAALFPAAAVQDASVRIAADETVDVIIVEQAGHPMLEIDDSDGVHNAPGTDDPLIGKVRAVGGPVRGPGGERLGARWKGTGFDLAQCEIGNEEDVDKVICARLGDGQVTYVFTVPGWDSEELPPAWLLRKKGYLSQIVWTRPPVSAKSDHH